MKTDNDDNNENMTYHLMVERANWSEILRARREGVGWDKLRTREGMSALGMAIFEGSAVATQTLLELGAPIKTEKLYNGEMFSPLWYSLEKKKPTILELLLEFGADSNEEHEEYKSPISYTSENKLIEETVILCKYKANPNIDKTPSPLWLWIKHTKPYKDENEYVLPDTRAILSIIKNGAMIKINEMASSKSGKGEIGMNEIEFAKRHWGQVKLNEKDTHNAMMLISLMEKNMLKGSGEIKSDRQSEISKI